MVSRGEGYYPPPRRGLPHLYVSIREDGIYVLYAWSRDQLFRKKMANEPLVKLDTAGHAQALLARYDPDGKHKKRLDQRKADRAKD